MQVLRVQEARAPESGVHPCTAATLRPTPLASQHRPTHPLRTDCSRGVSDSHRCLLDWQQTTRPPARVRAVPCEQLHEVGRLKGFEDATEPAMVSCLGPPPPPPAPCLQTSICMR